MFEVPFTYVLYLVLVIPVVLLVVLSRVMGKGNCTGRIHLSATKVVKKDGFYDVDNKMFKVKGGFRGEDRFYYVEPDDVQDEDRSFGRVRKVIDFCANSFRSMGFVDVGGEEGVVFESDEEVEVDGEMLKVWKYEDTSLSGFSFRPDVSGVYDAKMKNHLNYLAQGKYFTQRRYKMQTGMVLMVLGCGGLLFKIVQGVLARFEVFI